MNLAVSPQENLTVIVSGLSFLFVVMMASLGLIVRITRKWTSVENKLDHMTENLATIVRNNDKVHEEIVAQMREDRRASNERLVWLERNVYPRLVSAPYGPGG